MPPRPSAERFDVIVIGAGAAGLTAAGGLGLLGLRVALVERSATGGDCLNTGCVPSKALLAAAADAHAAHRFSGRPPTFAAAMARVRAAIAAVAPHDSPERMAGMGVTVIFGEAEVLDPCTVAVAEQRLSAPRLVVATGSRPAVPDEVARVPHLTNETLWDLAELPRHLIIVGGGPVGCEMAQAFRRLGSEVTVVTRDRLLPRDDEEAAELVADALRAEGVSIVMKAAVVQARGREGAIELDLDTGEALAGSHLLVATGRRATVPPGLERCGVEIGSGGIRVDARRRTANRRIRAIGDCREGPRFTHVSGYEGGLIVQQLGFGLPDKADYRALPWVTYTDPELAQVGLTERQARERGGRVTVWREDFADNDRALATGDAGGFVKIVRAGRRVVGVTIVGRNAGELILPWIQIVAGKSSSFGLAGLILPYPTRSEASKAAAFAMHEPQLFGQMARSWAWLLARARRGPTWRS